jgi:osmotically-inducible protein OsmY
MRMRRYSDLCARACRVRSRAPERQLSVWRATSFLGGAAVGAGLVYLLDAERGHRRRLLMVDRAAGSVRGSSRHAAQAIRIAGTRARGRAKGFLHRLSPSATEPPDDGTLADKVESVVFGNPKFAKGRINITAEQGEVFLRGQVDRPELIHDLEEAVRKVPGVRGVENRLHLPATPGRTLWDVHTR